MDFRSEYIRRGHVAARVAFERLRTAIKRKHGHGAITRLETALGFEKGWFRWHARPGAAMSFENILACLTWAEIHPRRFFSELFDHEAFAQHGEGLPRGERPAIIDLAGSEPSDKPRRWRRLIMAADNARYESPYQALENLTRLAPTVPPEHKPLLLAVAGSCYRSLYSIPRAIGCLQAAREINDNEWLEGNILQRLVYCLQPTEPKEALKLGERAQLIFSTLGNRKKVAETLVDQAIILGRMERYPEAEHAFENIFNYHYKNLNDRYRVAAAHGMAECCARQGKLQKAAGCLDEAVSSLKGNADTSNIRAHLHWTAGKLTRDTEQLDMAIEIFGTKHFFESACVAIDYCELLLQANRPTAARDLAITTRRMATKLGDSVIARMFENILAQISMNRKINWAARRTKVLKRRERHFHSLLRRSQISLPD